MTPLLAAAAHAVAAAAALGGAPTMTPDAVVAKYTAALAALSEPRTFTVQYTLEQTGTRTLQQSHQIYRNGGDERDETIAVNGTRATNPEVRIFRARPYRYSVARLAPRGTDYVFSYVGPHKDGRHIAYVFNLTPKSPQAFVLSSVTIDGLTFLPSAVAFATRQNSGAGVVTFGKSDRYWVASGAQASAHVRGGVAHERLTFTAWRFPATLPPSTFAAARPLPVMRVPPG